MTHVDIVFTSPNIDPTPLSPFATMDRRRTSTSSINERNRRRAVVAVNCGQSYRAAAASNCVKTFTLHRRVSRRPPESTMKNKITVKVEDLLVFPLKNFAHRGVRLAKENLNEAIVLCVNRMDTTRRLLLPFHFGNPGRPFQRGFGNRHKATLSFSKPLRKETNQFAAVNREVLTTHFATLQNFIVENYLDASPIFSPDESGATSERDMHVVLSSKRLTPRSEWKNLRKPKLLNVSQVTTMPIINAIGACVPSPFVFKGKKLSLLAMLKNGYVTKAEANLMPYSVNMPVTREENRGIRTKSFVERGYKFIYYVQQISRN